MVHKLWTDQKYLLEGDCQRRFIWKLKDLKTITKRWAKESRDRDLKVLENLEENIKQHLQLLSEGSILPEVESNLIKLELERNKLLKAQEDLW
jgi:hypothetical protein